MKSKQFKFPKIYIIFSLLLIILLTTSCEDNPSDSLIGEKFIDPNSSVTMIDTFTVELSTVKLDTLIGNGTGRSLLGSYIDKTMGRITSSSFFQLGTPSNLSNFDSTETYDSLTLIIRYNDYSVGDTTVPQTLYVYRLNENIEYQGDVDDELIPSSHVFNYDDTPIGSVTYTPYPSSSSDTIRIKLDDNLGNELYDLFKNDSALLSSIDDFLDYFHGLYIKADDNYTGSIVGFLSYTNNIKMILHTTESDGSTTSSYEFGLYDFAKQYNHFESDLSVTELAGLNLQSNSLSSSLTGGLSYIQGGVGLLMKVNLPTIESIKSQGKISVVNAQLDLVISKDSSAVSDIPSSLLVYYSTEDNRRKTALTDLSDNIVFSELSFAGDDNSVFAYSFDMSQFVSDVLSDSSLSTFNGFLITPSPGELEGTLTQLRIDAENVDTKLKLYYVNY